MGDGMSWDGGCIIGRMMCDDGNPAYATSLRLVLRLGVLVRRHRWCVRYSSASG